MNLAVIDTAVFVAGVFWRHEPHRCLKAWLRGKMTPVMTEEILAEYEAALEQARQEQHFTTDTALWLNTLRTSALWVTPVPFQDQVCRDPKDNKFVEAALGEQECYTIIARDRDLTVSAKPFGIDLSTPREWLQSIHRPADREAAHPRPQRKLIQPGPIAQPKWENHRTLSKSRPMTKAQMATAFRLSGFPACLGNRTD